jgi:molecular chaperone DnaJ
MKDYYQVLGIPRNATSEDIKKAFRRLAHQYHPDKSGGNEDKFKEVNEAYQVLGNEQKRSHYDRFGSAGNGSSPGSGQGFEWDFSNFGQGFEGVDLGDIFGDIFGFGQAGNSAYGRQTPRGRDIAIDTELSFPEAVFGIDRSVLLRKSVTCASCKGTSRQPGTDVKSCSNCNGSGSVHETRRSFIGSITKLRPCSTCNGVGEVPKEPCRTCHGNGVMQASEDISISIPPGIQDGEMIKLVGKGEAVANGITGDLYIKIHVLPDKRYNRTGHDITTILEITVTDALLGTEKKLETLDGFIQIQIPTGTEPGAVLRIRGKGVPRSRGGRGDLLIKIIIKIPRKISRKAKYLLEDLKKEGL